MDQVIEKSSVLEKIENGRNEILRVCFVCTGNTCRSPMAAALLTHLNKGGGRQINASSAGLSAIDGMPISANAVGALEDAGVRCGADNDYVNHKARTVSVSDIALNDLIIGISSSHAMALMGRFPQFASKMICMDEDISDPFGGDLEDYISCLDKIHASLLRMFFEK